jgi:hypothetical protein
MSVLWDYLARLLHRWYVALIGVAFGILGFVKDGLTSGRTNFNEINIASLSVAETVLKGRKSRLPTDPPITGRGAYVDLEHAVWNTGDLHFLACQFRHAG